MMFRTDTSTMAPVMIADPWVAEAHADGQAQESPAEEMLSFDMLSPPSTPPMSPRWEHILSPSPPRSHFEIPVATAGSRTLSPNQSSVSLNLTLSPPSRVNHQHSSTSLDHSTVSTASTAPTHPLVLVHHGATAAQFMAEIDRLAEPAGASIPVDSTSRTNANANANTHTHTISVAATIAAVPQSTSSHSAMSVALPMSFPSTTLAAAVPLTRHDPTDRPKETLSSAFSSSSFATASATTQASTFRLHTHVVALVVHNTRTRARSLMLCVPQFMFYSTLPFFVPIIFHIRLSFFPLIRSQPR
jgi:hypothetical protein